MRKSALQRKTPEQKAAHEKAEKEAKENADELIHQEKEEKEKQLAKDAKSKKAAAKNNEKAREAAAQQRKSKEDASEAEKTPAQKRREKAKPKDDDPGDEPPPPGDDRPWEVYHCRPITPFTETFVHESEDRGLISNYLEPTFALIFSAPEGYLPEVQRPQLVSQLIPSEQEAKNPRYSCRTD